MVERRNVASLYLSDEETKMLDSLADKFTSDWEKATSYRVSRQEIVRRMIHYQTRSVNHE